MSARSGSYLLQVPWLLAGNVFYSLYQWGLIALVAKTWGATQVGEFAFGLAVCGPLFLFTNMNLRTLLATDVDREFLLRHYFFLRLKLSVGALAVAVAIGTLLGGLGGEALRVLVAVAWLKFIESMSDLAYGALQQSDDLRGVGVSMTVRSAASFLLALVLLTRGVSLWQVVLSVSLVWGTLFILLDLPRARSRWTGAASGAMLSRAKPQIRLMARALPLGVVAALVSLDANLPRYIVKAQGGDSELGIYAGIGFIILAGNNIVVSACQSVVSRLATDFRHHRISRFRRTVSGLIAGSTLLCILGGLVAWSFGDAILGSVYSNEYVGRETLFSVLVLGAAFGYGGLILQYATTAVGRYKSQIVVYVVSILVTGGASWWLGNMYGTTGVAVGRSLGWFTQFGLMLPLLIYWGGANGRNTPDAARGEDS